MAAQCRGVKPSLSPRLTVATAAGSVEQLRHQRLHLALQPCLQAEHSVIVTLSRNGCLLVGATYISCELLVQSPQQHCY